MTMRDKIAAVIVSNRACDNWHDPMPADLELADVIIAALPGMVPNLVWEMPQVGFYDAPVIGGRMQIMWDTSPRDGVSYVLHPGTNERQVFLTLDDAKAAANVHNRAAVCKIIGL